jgi:hypothetical protein
VALAGDHVLNTLLLGDPNETLSRRIARARAAGQRWAVVTCRVLQAVLGGHGATDHCTWALTNSEPLGSREVWNWNK